MGTPCFSATAMYMHERHDGRGVDGHRGGDLSSGMPSKRISKSRRVEIGHALLAHLAPAHRVVGVVAHERGHVEGGGEPGHAVRDEVLEALVGVLRRAEAGELAHRPEPAAVHRRLDAAGVGELAGQPEVPGVLARPVGRGEHVGNGDAGVGGELGPAIRRAGECSSPPRPAPRPSSTRPPAARWRRRRSAAPVASSCPRSRPASGALPSRRGPSGSSSRGAASSGNAGSEA